MRSRLGRQEKTSSLSDAFEWGVVAINKMTGSGDEGSSMLYTGRYNGVQNRCSDVVSLTGVECSVVSQTQMQCSAV